MGIEANVMGTSTKVQTLGHPWYPDKGDWAWPQIMSNQTKSCSNYPTPNVDSLTCIHISKRKLLETLKWCSRLKRTDQDTHKWKGNGVESRAADLSWPTTLDPWNEWSRSIYAYYLKFFHTQARDRNSATNASAPGQNYTICYNLVHRIFNTVGKVYNLHSHSWSGTDQFLPKKKKKRKEVAGQRRDKLLTVLWHLSRQNSVDASCPGQNNILSAQTQ